MTRARAHVRTVAILSLPLLALAVAGSARLTSGWAPVLISWALLSAAALLTFFRQEASSPAVFAWALALWLYATPVLGFLRERPDPAVGAAVLLAAAGLAAAARDVRARAWAPASGALGAAAGVALVITAVGGGAPAAPEPLTALFSSRHGLFFHWPVTWAGLLGLPLATRRTRQRTAALTGLAIVLSASACLPRSRPDLNVLVLPFVAPGLLACLEAVRRVAAKRPLVPLAAGGVLLVVWNFLLMQQYLDERIPRDDTVSFADVAEGNARLWAERAGSPVAWPANWLFAARRRLSPARFDLMAGKELPERNGRWDLDVGRLDLDQSLLAEGWSVRHPCGRGVCRAVEGRARFFMPLPAAEMSALVVSTGGEGRLGVRLNGRPVGWLRLTAGEDARLPVPSGLFRRGLNEIVFDAPDGPVLVDRVAVARDGG